MARSTYIYVVLEEPLEVLVRCLWVEVLPRMSGRLLV